MSCDDNDDHDIYRDEYENCSVLEGRMTVDDFVDCTVGEIDGLNRAK